MAASANTSTAVRFLRRLSGMMEPPVLKFPAGTGAVVWRKGDGVIIPGTPDGKIEKASGAITNSDLDGGGLVGFFYGPSSEAPVFPTSAGVQGSYTSPTISGTEPIPEDEQIEVVLALQDCVFIGHQLNNVTDITAPVRAPAAATGGLMIRMGLRESTPTGETSRVFVDSSVQGTGEALVIPTAYAYPQPLPAARSVGASDPWRVRLGASGTSNPAVEFMVTGGVWVSVSGQT